jgi:hypothetical protein
MILSQKRNYLGKKPERRGEWGKEKMMGDEH